MVDMELVKDWARRYAEAWETGDDDAILALFTPDARYRSSPFREPHLGHGGIRAYWQRAAGSQINTRVHIGEPIVSAERACIEWWATFQEADGQSVTLPGALIVTLNAAGRCTDLREYWNATIGTIDPFAGWGH